MPCALPGITLTSAHLVLLQVCQRTLWQKPTVPYHFTTYDEAPFPGRLSCTVRQPVWWHVWACRRTSRASPASARQALLALLRSPAPHRRRPARSWWGHMPDGSDGHALIQPGLPQSIAGP